MGIVKSIIDDYENLIKTKITIPLDNGDIIRFEFKPQDLPHLLGLQYLVDNPILFEYNQKRLSATNLYKGMCDGSIDIVEFENSNYFEEVYENRIKYFSTSMILDIISEKLSPPTTLSKITNLFLYKYITIIIIDHAHIS